MIGHFNPEHWLGPLFLGHSAWFVTLIVLLIKKIALVTAGQIFMWPVSRVDIFVWSLDIFVRGEDIFVTTVCRIWRWSEMRRPHAAAVTPASLCFYVSLGPWSLQTSVWLTKYFPTQLHMSGLCFHVAICPRPASCSWTNNWFAHLRCGDYVLVSPSAWQCHTLRDITTCIRDRPEFLPHLATAAPLPLSVMVPVSRVSWTHPTLETWSPVNTDKRCSRFPGV